MTEHAKLLRLAKYHSVGMGLNDPNTLAYHTNKYSLVCDLLADLGEVRFRRVGR